MRQVQQQTITSLVSAGLVAAGGADTLAATLILGVNNKGDAIRATLDILTDARDAHRASVLELKERRAIVKALIGSAKAFLTLAREVHKRKLGKKHGPGWIEAGWEHNLGISRTAAGLVPHLQTQNTFLTAKPEFEVPMFNITAAEADMLFNKVTNAVVAVNEQITIVKSGLLARNAAKKKMSAQLSGVFRELKVLLTPMDPRWKTFGFNLPGAPETPDVPTNVIAVLIGTNAISVKWAAAARAESYRVSYRVLGTHVEFISAGLPSDLDFTLENLPANSQVEITISAVNSGGESAPTEPVKVTTH